MENTKKPTNMAELADYLEKLSRETEQIRVDAEAAAGDPERLVELAFAAEELEQELEGLASLAASLLAEEAAKSPVPLPTRPE